MNNNNNLNPAAAGRGGQRGRVPKSFDLSNVKCRVHPTVVLTILDGYGRRSAEKKFVIAALLGSISTEHTAVEVSDCFVLEYKWNEGGDEKKDLDIVAAHYEGILALKQRINPQAQIVGFGCTMPTAAGTLNAALNDWVHREKATSKFQAVSSVLPEPIHLLVDATLGNSCMSVKAFVRGPLHVAWRELPVEITPSAAERVSTKGILRAKLQGEVSASTAIQQSDPCAALEQILALTTKAEAYAKAVVDGAIEGDLEVGRTLFEALGAEPLVAMEAFEKLSKGSLEENLTISCLSSLARLQFGIAEKLNLSFA